MIKPEKNWNTSVPEVQGIFQQTTNETSVGLMMRTALKLLGKQGGAPTARITEGVEGDEDREDSQADDPRTRKMKELGNLVLLSN
jgi:hypothetical protein